LVDLIWRMTEKSTVPERLNVVTGRLTISHPLEKIESIRKAGVDGRAF
jgi:hypothetical protein